MTILNFSILLVILLSFSGTYQITLLPEKEIIFQKKQQPNSIGAFAQLTTNKTLLHTSPPSPWWQKFANVLVSFFGHERGLNSHKFMNPDIEIMMQMQTASKQLIQNYQSFVIVIASKDKKKDGGGGGMGGDSGDDAGEEGEGVEDAEAAAQPPGVTEEQVRTVVRDANQELIVKLEESTEDIKTEVQNNTEYLRVEVAKEAKNLTEYIGRVEKNLTKKITIVDISVQESLLQQNQLSYLITEQTIIDLKQRLPELLEVAKKLQGLLPQKTDECNEIIQCDVCTKNKKCGWCEQEKRCVTGDKIGPTNEICAFYSFTDCSSPNCGQFMSCSTCLLSPSCGWCRDQNQLIEGCIEADENYQGCPEWFHIKGDNAECVAPLENIENINEANSFPSYVDAELERESQIESKTPVERNLFSQQVVISLQAKAMMMKDIYDTVLENFRKLQDLKFEYKILQEEVDKRKADEDWMAKYEKEKKKKDSKKDKTKGEDGDGGNETETAKEGEGEAKDGEGEAKQGEAKTDDSDKSEKSDNSTETKDTAQSEKKIKKPTKEEVEELQNNYVEQDSVLLAVKQFLEDYEQHNQELKANQQTDEEQEAAKQTKPQFLMFVQKPNENPTLCSLLEEIFQL